MFKMRPRVLTLLGRSGVADGGAHNNRGNYAILVCWCLRRLRTRSLMRSGAVCILGLRKARTSGSSFRYADGRSDR
jgi:hypothetical protein